MFNTFFCRRGALKPLRMAAVTLDCRSKSGACSRHIKAGESDEIDQNLQGWFDRDAGLDDSSSLAAAHFERMKPIQTSG
jgi:murein endopeptidase